MKKYFCKFLPVEGEIKEGDMVKTMGEVMQLYQDGKMPSNKRAYQLYKLFLCSRDMKKGDEVYHIGTNKSFKLNHDMRDDDPMKESLFKIVGEISPDALSYVKEGDEFDEGEVRKATDLEIYWADASEQFQYRTIYGNADQSYSPKQGDTYNESIIDEKIEVRCSCCKKFH